VVGLHAGQLAGRQLGAEIDAHAVVIRLSELLSTLPAQPQVCTSPASTLPSDAKVANRLAWGDRKLSLNDGLSTQPSQNDSGTVTSLLVVSAKHLARCTHPPNPRGCSGCFTSGAHSPVMVDYTSRLGGGTPAPSPGTPTRPARSPLMRRLGELS
jgi:hypothetical protein